MSALARVGMIVTALAAVACGGRPAAPPPLTPEEAARGQALWDDWACSACHGTNGEGGDAAPPLTAVAQDWTMLDLAEYLRDPEASIESNPRLRSLSGRYQGAQMPPFDYPLADRKALAAWLIDRSHRR